MIDLAEKTPEVLDHSENREMRVTEALQPQISAMFPGNTVTGTLTRSQEVHYPLKTLLCNAMEPKYRLIPVGKAKLSATNGILVGRSAPRFVSDIFPGLDFTEYPYDKMTSFTTFLPTGASESETFFFGAYDAYLEGVTDPEHHVQYTMGLVLLGSAFPPENLRDWKQGRVPILKIKGRIEKGKLVDDDVSYPLPNETLFEIFLKNNLVYRAWVNLHNKPSAPAPK
jgi:hypothetical protein